MNILVTGAAGQLGRDCVELLGQNNSIIPCNSKQLDISNQVMVDTLIDEELPDLIVNCAAFTAVDNCESMEGQAMAVNGHGPAYLAGAAARNKARLIHISTDYVFDGKKKIPHPYLEDDPVSPLSIYGKSKLAGEQAVAKNCPDSLILRTAWLYGDNGKNFLKTMLRLVIADPTRQLQVVNDQYGSLTWSRSLARQIEKVITSKLRGIAHATAEGCCTWFEAASYFLAQMDVPHNLAPCDTSEYPTPAARPINSILENHRLKEAGLMVMQDWKKDIEDFVGLYKDALIKEAG